MKFIIITCKMIPTLLLGRPEPIMLLELRIMLLSIIPKTSLLCLKLCSGILSDNVKFNNILYEEDSCWFFCTHYHQIYIYIMTPAMYFVEFITFNHYIHHIPNFIVDSLKISVLTFKFMPLWHTLHKKFTYYAGIMLDTFTILLCSKLCWHNWLRPSATVIHEISGINFYRQILKI